MQYWWRRSCVKKLYLLVRAPDGAAAHNRVLQLQEVNTLRFRAWFYRSRFLFSLVVVYTEFLNGKTKANSGLGSIYLFAHADTYVCR